MPIYRELFPLIVQKYPTFAPDNYPVRAVKLTVKRLKHSLPTFQGNIVFARIPSHDYCDIFFHPALGEI